MNIKSLLLGSAAALAVVSGAQAADAIVAAEPEPMEYVRVCDAFGTGFFYIPGTETCLKISGEVRVNVAFGEDRNIFTPSFTEDDKNWDSSVRARVNFEARNDSELGTIGSFIRLQGSDTGSVEVEQAYITVGGFKVGYFTTFVDDFGLAGESDFFFTQTKNVAASYTYASDAFTVGFGIDDLTDFYEGGSGVIDATGDNEIGLEAMVSASFGVASLAVYGAYDIEASEGAVGAVISAEVGPGTLAVAGAYSSGINAYTNPDLDTPLDVNHVAQWAIGAAYSFKATDKLTLTAAANYYGDYLFIEDLGGDKINAWSADLLAEYALAEGLKASANIRYTDFDADGADAEWDGFVRLTRSF
ncbi:MAG: porin [Allorhizobium sp.]